MPTGRTCLKAASAALLIVSVLAGCASSSGAAPGFGEARSAAAGAVAPLTGQESPTPGPPSWLTHYPTSSTYFIGIGGASDTGNPSSDIEAAEKSARNALAAEIATTIKSETSLKTSANAKGATKQSVSVLINEQVNLTLTGVQLVDSYHSKKWGYWYYYRLPRASLDPRPRIEQGVHALFKELKGPTALSLGSITYSNTGLSSGLSLYLQDQILLALRGHEDIHVSARPETGKASEPSVKTGQMPPLLLSGSFFGTAGNKVSVFLRLTDGPHQTVVASSSFALDPSMLPRSLSIEPVNYATAAAAKSAIVSVGASSTSNLKVHLAPTRGDGATYFDGEDLVLDVSANRNCYIKLYHIDVNGKVSLILPNRYSRDNLLEAGRVYHIPPPGAGYRFRLGKPYGVELIKIVASTRQFANIEPAFTDLGTATRGLLTRGLTVTGAGPEETAQATVSYTILAKGQ